MRAWGIALTLLIGGLIAHLLGQLWVEVLRSLGPLGK
jgi:hypothetical protein